MPAVIVDLSSDTQTRPTPGMRAAIAAAEVGDEQWQGDPTTAALERRVAELMGKHAGLFLATGTLCNNVALAAHTRRGDVAVAHRLAHVVRFEAAGSAMHAGVLVDQVDGPNGQFDADALRAALQPGGLHLPRPRVVCLEQTANLGGGSVWPLDRWDDVIGVARAFGAAVHVDGARLLNAVVASGVPADRWAQGADSIWLDFTKGLGGPLGAVLCGSAAFVEEARRVKHQFGAALRQSGMMAAGALYALDHHVERLADDHGRARRLADGLAALGCRLDPEPETNIVFFDPAPTGVGAAAWVAAWGEAGVRCGAVGARVRAVTHLDVDDAGIDHALVTAAAITGRG